MTKYIVLTKIVWWFGNANNKNTFVPEGTILTVKPEEEDQKCYVFVPADNPNFNFVHVDNEQHRLIRISKQISRPATPFEIIRFRLNVKIIQNSPT